MHCPSCHPQNPRGACCTGVNAAKDDTQAVAKQIKLLENKLEAALIKLNEAVGRNKVLRDNIDHLRRERVTFDQVRARDAIFGMPACQLLSHRSAPLLANPQVYRKIERDLHDRKREMSNVIDITNLAREARDQARNEIAALRAQNDREQTAFDAEYREVLFWPTRLLQTSDSPKRLCSPLRWVT